MNSRGSNSLLSLRQDQYLKREKSYQYPSLTVLLGLFLVALFALNACTTKGLKRPYGFMRLGKISELAASETYLPDLRLVVRMDEKGFSVMSTACTLDLTPLTRIDDGGKVVWRSSYSESSYAYDGAVIQGPTKAPLPFYDLKIDSSVYGGPKDALYAEVGVERPKEWRFSPG